MKELGIDEIITWVIRRLTESIKISPAEISIDKDFSDYGIDSLKAVSLVGEIEEWIGKELPATTLWDYTTVRQLASFIHEELSVSSPEVDC